MGLDHDRLAEAYHGASPFAAAGGTIAIPWTAPRFKVERPTPSGMAPKNVAATFLKGCDVARNGTFRSNTSQRQQVVDGHGHCVRNRRNSQTLGKSPERVPPSPLDFRQA
jgi:hypothetical protein